MSGNVDRSRLDARIQVFRSTLQGLPNRVVAGLALELERDMKIEAPIQTGRLRNSIEAQISGDSARVGTSVKYAKGVARGTPPHKIEPKTKKALAWPGGPGPRKVVFHPGTKANPFDLRAAAKLKAKAQAVANEIVKREMARV